MATAFRKLAAFLTCLLLAGCLKGPGPAAEVGAEDPASPGAHDSAEEQTLPPVSAADLKVLVEGNNEFAFDLYARLRDTEGNLVFSPYSISSALAMTYAGARGETAAQMAKTLHFRLEDGRLHAAFAQTTRQLRADRRQQGCTLQPEATTSYWT